MLPSVQHYVAEKKLRELRRQRDRLRASYLSLETQLAQSGSSLERLRLLRDGLEALTLASRPLHEDHDNLSMLLYSAESTQASPLLDFWLEHLQHELQIGKLRAEVVAVFGALLEEYVASGEGDPHAQSHRIAQELAVTLGSPAVGLDYGEFLAPLLKDFGELSTETPWLRPHQLHYTDIQAQLHRIEENPFRPFSLRQQARLIGKDNLLSNELADALTLEFEHVQDWQWQADGVPIYARQTGGKWRLMLDEDLPSALFLQFIGLYSMSMLDATSRGTYTFRLQRLKRLLELGAPQVIVQNERRMIEQHHKRFLPDIWGSEQVDTTASIDEQLKQVGDHESIVAKRLEQATKLRSAVWQVNYLATGYEGGMKLMVRFLNAEIRLWQAAYPEQPLYVLKADLKDSYPSIRHDVLLTILEQLGMTEADQQLIERILKVPMQVGDQVMIAERGLMNDRVLSHMLGELLLLVLEQYLHRVAQLQVIRVVDDICILATSEDGLLAAWQALHEFCDAVGLAINEAKSGAVCINGSLPEALSLGLPAWQFLRLTSAGEWEVDPDRFDAYIAETREAVNQSPSVIGKVDVYNQHLRDLLAALTPDVNLGERHQQSVRAAAERFYKLYDDTSILDMLHTLIQYRFLGKGQIDLPDGWFFFPITAGGLGLLHALIEVGTFALTHDRIEPVTVPAERESDWQRKDNAWSLYYRHWLTERSPSHPRMSPVMDVMVKDFVQRGTEMSGNKQDGLSAYWKWILYLYGPPIIDQLGSFRFLITELVPLDLIVKGRGNP
jgi:hypothetical protein